MKNIKTFVVGCCAAIGLAAIACGGEVAQGPKGDSIVGPPGAEAPPPVDGKPGNDGKDSVVPGPAGQNGEGSQGVAGDRGETGEPGDSGLNGSIPCGDDLIAIEEWHSACNVDAGNNGSGTLVCTTGQVQCRLYLSNPDNESSEVLPKKVCYDTVNHHVSVAPGDLTAGSTCNVDLNCDGVLDDTTGEGDNVTLVRQSVQAECKVSGSSWSCDRTLVGGLCRNAKKHCLLPGGNVCRADANGEGVLWSDFVSAAHEGDMGYECTTNPDGTVHTWECVVDGGVASVSCTGPRGL